MTAPFRHPAVLCQVCGQVPAANVVISWVAVSAWDHEHDRMWVCDRLTCLGLAQIRAEAVGIHLDTEPLTRAVAEDVTGLDLTQATP